MKKRLYKGMPGYWVFHYSNTIKDLFDEKRWKHNHNNSLHKWLRPYIKKYRGENGRILRTGGAHHSKNLARKIFNRLLELVKEDMIEENDFFFLPNGDCIGHRTDYIFNPDTLNRRPVTFLLQSQHSAKKIGNNYKFVFDDDGLRRLGKKLLINGNGNSIGKNYHCNAGSKPQEFAAKRERYRRMVWGMH